MQNQTNVYRIRNLNVHKIRNLRKEQHEQQTGTISERNISSDQLGYLRNLSNRRTFQNSSTSLSKRIRQNVRV